MVQQILNKLVNGSVERFKKKEMMRAKVAQGLNIEKRKYQNSIYNQKYKKGNPRCMVVQLITGA